MPYDTYTIEELRCDSNKGMTLIPAFDVVVSRNKTVIDLGTLTDEYEPEITIHTTAADKATGEKSIVAGKSVTIVDTVTLDGLKKGTKYQLKGWQMVKSENAQLLVDGKPVENDYTFTTKDSKTNPDKPIKVAEHKDIDDEGQTVTVKEQPETLVTPEESDTPETPSRAGSSPKTGDNTPLAALLAMLGISSAGLIFAAYKRFYKKKAD